jgi:hypothetical protein
VVEAMTVSTSRLGQSYVRIWVGLLASGLSFWLIITHAGLVLEVALVLFGAVLVSSAIRPLTDLLARKQGLLGVLFAVPAAVVLAFVQELRTVQKVGDANLSTPNTVEEG